MSPEPTPYIKQSEGERNRTIEFTDDLKQEERAIRRILGTQEDIQYSQLDAIEEICFVGMMSPVSLKGVTVSADGKVTVNGPEVKQGSVGSLKLVSVMPYLRKAALIKQPVTDVSGLSGMMRLQEVNLSCSSVSSLKGLTNLPCLQVLNLTHTQVKDLTPLRELENLEKVIVSVDMLPMTLDPERDYDVILVE